ncbi:hypothetical protein K523DRAFT_150081 [Schizophyllum commune Tattone D]|nr:hypothetical protein K523DRAFT_150081 [Schizophyllum commune Tattone D]
MRGDMCWAGVALLVVHPPQFALILVQHLPTSVSSTWPLGRPLHLPSILDTQDSMVACIWPLSLYIYRKTPMYIYIQKRILTRVCEGLYILFLTC